MPRYYLSGDEVKYGDQVSLDGGLAKLPGPTVSFMHPNGGIVDKQNGDRAFVVAVDQTNGLDLEFFSDPGVIFSHIRPDIWRLLARHGEVAESAPPTARKVGGLCSCGIDQLMSGGCNCGAIVKYAAPRWGNAK